MSIDFAIRNARLPRSARTTDIGVEGGLIVAIEPGFVCDAPEYDAGGKLVCGGLIETHIHLDKAGIIGRCSICSGTLAEAVSETAKAKALFTEEDVYQRAALVLDKAIPNGTNRVRAFVEIDPRAGYRSFGAIKRLKADYARAIEIEICAFAQEGLTNEPATEAMLNSALASGADCLGGCPYTDPQPAEHIRRIFDLAERHRVPVDFHLDFDLQPSRSNLPEVVAQTLARGYEGRVSVGHVTKMSAMRSDELEALAGRLASAGIAVTALPSTDLFLMGREFDHLTPRGVAPVHRLAAQGVVTTLSTNNVLNPFTPFGDVSLMRMANLYANVAQIGAAEGLAGIFDMITSLAAKLLGNGSKSLEVGAPANLVVFDAGSCADAVAEIAPAVAGWKDGRQTFRRPPPELLLPGRQPARR